MTETIGKTRNLSKIYYWIEVHCTPCHNIDIVQDSKSKTEQVQEEATPWTGFEKDTSPIAPLTPETFVQRLERLSNAVLWMRKARNAVQEQHTEYAAIHSEDFAGLMERALHVEISGITYHVASIEDLIAMKRQAGRPQDLSDIEELESIRARIQPQ